MAADNDEAIAWLKRRMPRGTELHSLGDVKHEAMFSRRGVEMYRAVHHTRWVSGF
jgi:hypothetical protein